jgi:hypothetical protein
MIASFTIQQTVPNDSHLISATEKIRKFRIHTESVNQIFGPVYSSMYKPPLIRSLT